MAEQLTLLDDQRTDPAGQPPDQAARDRIRTDTATTLFVEAGAGAGKTTALVARILTLVDEGVPIDVIAAITFSEKAAAELRHRLRAELDQPDDGPLRHAALEGLDHAPIGTLHAFARRILFEFPVEAGLPPGFDVLDELESQLALDERWEDLLDELLDDAERQPVPGLTAAELVQLLGWGSFRGTASLRQIVEDFQSNWDLVEQRVALTAPTRPGGCRHIFDRLAALVATPVPPDDTQAALMTGVGDGVRSCGDDVGSLLNGLEDVKRCLAKAARQGDRGKWSRYGGQEALEAHRAEAEAIKVLIDGYFDEWRRYRQAVVGAIAGRFVLDGAAERSAAGTLEFHDLLVLARRLLATQPDVRARLHDRYRRLLLDEFQDTDPIQLEIAIRLTAPPAGQAVDGVAGLRPVPGRLFVVGDPKQSIYRFRRADIAMYLAAAGQVGAEREVLSANFRSTDAVIDWVNGVFGTVIQPEPGVQPAYGALDACRPEPRGHGTVHILGSAAHDDVAAEELRWREAESVGVAVVTALRDQWLVGDGEGGLRPCRPDDIAVLLPARTSLPMLEATLSRLTIPYRAENSSVVYVTPEIRHLMLALRAAADPTDALALVAALRSPLYGCSDVELYDWKQAGGSWRTSARPPDSMADHPVAVAIAHVASIAADIGRSTPAELLDRIVVERRVLETALGGSDARDVWRRVRYVVDQARAWTDAGGRGVRRYLRWAAYQAAEGRASDTILPERDHDAVRLMTVHAAKGLEFPITIVSGLTTKPRGESALSVLWPGDSWMLAERDNDDFQAYQPLDEQMGDAERRRLLYVACTRAVDHLVVSVHRKAENVAGEHGTAKATSATVLAEGGGLGHGARQLEGVVDPLAPAAGDELELPWADHVEWDAERARAIAVASVRSATSATGLATAIASAEPPDEGLQKDAVDLDLPPWQRGRYGTAVGRAVHAVLQDADLGDGADIDELAAAQCAAEGIFGLEERVASLSRSALTAPIVVAAAGGAQHWRELFVVAQLGDTVVEGYIDLLVRTPEGLVIVDYKTDQWKPGSDASARIARYRHQLAAYGLVLSRLLDEPIVGGVLVRCRPDQPAEQIPIEGWAEALEEVATITTLR